MLKVRIMANDEKPADSREPKFNFGVQELRQAERANAPAHSLALEEARSKSKNEESGFDPYNTSGSFDRKKHWERVRKR
jgi:hypothetical protein